MKNLHHLMYIALFFSGLILITGCNEMEAPIPADAGQQSLLKSGDDDDGDDDGGAQIPFDEVEVFFEFNTTDNDLGFQLFLDAEGWKQVNVFGPDGKIINFKAKRALKELGITELRFESSEPSPAEVLALFPPGDYKFRGRTVEGDKLVGTGELSHAFLAAPSIFVNGDPINGDPVDPDSTVIGWDAPGAERVQVIVGNEDLGHFFDVIVSPETTSLNVPPQFLQPATEYKAEVLAISANGNRTITEGTFVTE
ncbi:MAG: fibronectin type III domain-containing protein [Ignavibacteria bacterium]|nr:fibronectin type III domain-containing protein [Ignavibacteria bacterium]